MASQLAALAHARDAARDVGAGIARGRADLEAVLRAEIQAQTWLTAQQKPPYRPASPHALCWPILCGSCSHQWLYAGCSLRD